MRVVPLPNLFVVGAPKSGTTALHRYLDQHPQVAMSAVKEPKFFLADGRAPAHRGPGDERASAAYVYERREYEALFRYPPGRAGERTWAGESTPFYLWYPQAAPRIKALVPEARLIAVLREPVARAYSNWAHLRFEGRETLDFAAALDAEDRRAREDWEPFWFYRSLGLYGEQLDRLFDVFDRGQVFVTLAEHVEASPSTVLDQIWTFLGVEPLGAELVPQRLNEATYRPVDRRSRALTRLAQRSTPLRRAVPAPVRGWARETVRRQVRSRATTGAHAARLRREFGHLFAVDRRLLEAGGMDLAAWDEVDSRT